MPGLGQFLFLPMALAVGFTMIAAFFLSMTFVPVRSAAWLHPRNAEPAPNGQKRPRSGWGYWFHRWEELVDKCIRIYDRWLGSVMQHSVRTIVTAVTALAIVVVGFGLGSPPRFLPEVDEVRFK